MTIKAVYEQAVNQQGETSVPKPALSQERIRQEIEALGREMIEVWGADNLKEGSKANDDVAVAAWQRIFPLSPFEVAEKMLGNRTERTKIWIDFPEEGDAREAGVVLATHEPDAGAEALNAYGYKNEVPGRKMRVLRNFDFDTGIMRCNGARIYKSDQQEQGSGLEAVTNFFELSRALGMKTVTIKPAEVGTYVWAKCGFLPSQESWDVLRTKVVERFDAFLGDPDLGPQVPENLADEIRQILSSGDPHGIWVLADLKAEVAGMPIGKRLLLPGFEKIVPAYGEGRSEEEMEQRKLNWEGRLSFEDEGQNRRLNSYLDSKRASRQTVLPTPRISAAPSIV